MLPNNTVSRVLPRLTSWRESHPWHVYVYSQTDYTGAHFHALVEHFCRECLFFLFWGEKGAQNSKWLDNSCNAVPFDTFSLVISVIVYCRFYQYHLDYTGAHSHAFGEHFNRCCSFSVIEGEITAQNQSAICFMCIPLNIVNIYILYKKERTYLLTISIFGIFCFLILNSLVKLLYHFWTHLILYL